MRVKFILANKDYKEVETNNVYKKGDDVIIDNVKFYITDVATFLNEDNTESICVYISRELLLG